MGSRIFAIWLPPTPLASARITDSWMLSLADHTLDEAGYAAWLREHTAPNQP